MLANQLIQRKFLILCLILLPGILTLAQTSTTQTPQATPAQQKETYISALLDNIRENGRTVAELSTKNLSMLPVGVKRNFNNNEITIGVDSARQVPGGIIINVYTQVKLDGTSKKISFEGKHILITPGGIAITESTKLAIISDINIPISEKVNLLLPGDGSNYVEWDCTGFKSVNLKGLFKFSGDFIPDPKLSKDKSEVTAAFEVHVTDPNDIVASVSITPFRIKGMGDMAFAVQNATVDMSDYANAPNFVFPAAYKNPYKEMPTLWRGFFLKDLKIYLPTEMSKDNGRTVIDVNNMLIDESGFSGSFSVTPVLSFGDGDASGWPFSIDKLGITITQNNITGGLLSGKLGVPFLNNDTIGYAAQIEGTKQGMKYTFSVTTNAIRTFNLPFGGGIQLDKGSLIQVTLSNGKFVPSAMLNGILLLENDAIKAKGIRFEKLHLTTESPYILGGKFAVASSVGFKIQNFSFCIDSIALGIVKGSASLEFNVIVALMSSSDKGIAAWARFQVNASVHQSVDETTGKKGPQHWEYDGVRIKTMGIDCELSIFTLKGELTFYKNDEVYENGFHGEVAFTIKKIVPRPVSAEIYFGTKDDYKYWFVKVSVPVRIQIGTVTLLRITGGAYNRMKRKDQTSSKPVYVPDGECGIGFIAGVGLAVASDKLIYADVLLEIAFNKSGGLRFIRFDGSGTIFSGPVDNNKEKDNPDDPKAKSTAPVKITISLLFDNENDIFHANLKVYMNIVGVITGTGPNNLVGECVIHSDPHDWYIYIGRPSQMLGLNVLGLVKIQTYFMAGTKLEDMPLPPNEVASILGNIDLNFMKKENALKTGGGVAFGMRFNVGFGFGQNGGFVYAYFDVGAGGDIMLRNYGDAECYGRSGTMGIDGWYASGQAYTYLQGRLGIRVKHKEFDIMSVAAAMLMQAKGPNPTWFKGYMAARYRILGGLVKGSVHLTVSLGEECIVLTNAGELNGIKLIGDVKPAPGSSEVDVFTAPQVAFNTSIDREFSMMNIADEMCVYRLKLDDFKLVAGDNQTVSGATLQWNAEHDLAAMKLTNILPGKQNMTTSVKVHIEKKTSGGWEPLKYHDNIIYEDTVFNFVTGDEPTTVPDNNVTYSYPVKNQYNFYKNEFPKGYIKLNLGQPSLFRTQSDGKTWAFKAAFKSSLGNIIEAPASYDEGQAMINFDIPGNLSNSEVYTMDIVKSPIRSGGVDSNLARGDKAVANGNPEDSINLTSNQLHGSIASEGVTSLHSYAFRSSIYSSFSEKLSNFSGWRTGYAVDETLMSLLDIEASMSETFDQFELQGGGADFAPLVFAEAEMGNPWLDTHVKPTVYELYNTVPGITIDRNPDKLGIFPLKAMPIINFGESGYTLQNAQGNATAKSGDIAIRYFIPHYVYVDFSILRNKAATLYLGKTGIPEYAQRLLAGNIDDIYRGQYSFKVNYRLPGLNTITTSKEFKIVY